MSIAQVSEPAIVSTRAAPLIGRQALNFREVPRLYIINAVYKVEVSREISLVEGDDGLRYSEPQSFFDRQVPAFALLH